MRVHRPLYDILKKLQDSDGSTKDITYANVQELIKAGFVSVHEPKTPTDFRLKLTPMAHAAIEDRPLDPVSPQVSPEPEPPTAQIG